MPTTVEYSNNPNEETAFVTPEGGQRTRTVLTTPVDGTVKYPDNPNSTKVSVVVDGVARKAVAVYNVGGGDQHNKGYYATQSALETAYPTAEAGDYAIVGSTDTVWVWDEDSSAWVDTDTKGQVTPDMIIVKSSTMPTASTTPAGAVYQYVGASDANYTHGYIYENVATTTSSSATASQTTGSSLSDVAVVLATFETQITTSGSYAFTSDGTNWSYDGNTVDLTDYGITYTGTPVADDVITVVYTESSTTYAWTRIDVQPAPEALPSQTGNSGKFLTTDGTDASWTAVDALPDQTGNSGKFLITDGTDASWGGALWNSSNRSFIVGDLTKNTPDNLANFVMGTRPFQANYKVFSSYVVCIGDDAIAQGQYGVAIGTRSGANAIYTIALGHHAEATASYAIQLGYYKTNSDANTFKVGNENGNFEIMSADGTIPTARLTKVNTTITLTAADWSGGSQTVTVTGMTATGVVLVSPDPTDQAAYTSAGIICTAQAADSLTFTATTTPSGDIDVNIVCL